MNISFFLLPKAEVAFLDLESTMRQALEKMEYHKYSAVPIIDRHGKYIGTLTEGDLLWQIKNTHSFSLDLAEQIQLKDIKRRIKNMPVRIDSEMKGLLTLAISQNFIPVVDDHGIFIGIIRRREIIEYYANSMDKGHVS
ncbi:CBS domain-containing protein [Halalkalibacter akibai]|uniref:Inosine-5'-monophosphate dehydrogenase n=1 Tax=Halalkalibacter akibai (strain ATCC 43226 / DSM 21942 / CIP 109018 / JCM 9157 / 1139) TaxID=1236973 RepID=W4QQ94_HALA3|nr:CBS domain-containing protein [Halalkalibacter akibai]GAE34280.1 inosine-5'-monophosphate dehydrogenase [Halalkalibacter akibai JCM 9157]